MCQNCSMKAGLNKIDNISATCPGCGLLCDDIVLENNNNEIKALSTSCEKAVHFFEQSAINSTPKINGKPATLQQAILQAAKLIKASQQPLFAGLGTDVQGFRSIYNLSQKTNGSLKHANATSSQRNLNVLQSTGWQTTTLTEVKNRADVIVCIGTDVVSHNPRFFERIIDTDGLFVNAKNRQLIFVGNAPNKHLIKSDALQAAWALPCRADDFPSITGGLRALVQGKILNAPEIGGISLSDLTKLADKLKQAKYAVLIWIAKDLDFNYAELTIQNITQTVAALNEKTRAGGLPLGGSDGDTTANNTNTWLSGLALNDKFVGHDLMVWVNSFSPNKHAPDTNLPLIVLGNSNIEFTKAKAPDVFIPIATPGLDCSGTLFRVDGAVILPLKKVRDSELPTLSEVVKQIEALL